MSLASQKFPFVVGLAKAIQPCLRAELLHCSASPERLREIVFYDQSDLLQGINSLAPMPDNVLRSAATAATAQGSAAQPTTCAQQ
jgi:hypothetical protein